MCPPGPGILPQDAFSRLKLGTSVAGSRYQAHLEPTPVEGGFVRLVVPRIWTHGINLLRPQQKYNSCGCQGLQAAKSIQETVEE